MPENFDLERRVYKVLVEGEYTSTENRAPRPLLVYKLFGVWHENLSRSTKDRKASIAIIYLQEHGYPIFSSSGKGGYYLGNETEIGGYIAELKSRKAALSKKITRLKTAHRRTWSEPQVVTQERFL